MSHAADRFDLVISGASFAGLALARALAVEAPGLRVALVDPAPPPLDARPDSRAVTVSLSSRRMLGALGVWAAVADRAEAVTRIEITDSPLEAGVRPLLLSWDNEADGEPAAYVVPNGVLLAALRSSALATDGVAVIDAASVATFSADEAEVAVALSDGRRLTAALLVAADGRRSTLRDAAGIRMVDWSSGQTGIVVAVAHERPHGGVAVQHFLPSGPFALLPLKGDRCCVTWSERTEEARRILELDDAGFLAEIERRAGGKLGDLTLDGPRQSWPLDQSLAREYVAHRFALAGDSAHAVHPIAGQGANLAFRDAAALAETIVDAARLGLDAGAPPALDRYARWRRADSAFAALGYGSLNRLFSNDGMLTRAARSMGLRLVDRSAGLKSAFVREAAGLTGELPRLLRGTAASL